MQATKLARSALAGAAFALAIAGPACAATAAPVTVNPKQEASLPGKFIWFDGVTDDPAASEAFYGAVFGWTFEGVGAGEHRYTLIRNGGRNIGGLILRPRDSGAARGARWIVLMSVADPVRAATLRRGAGRQGAGAPRPLRGARHACAVPRQRGRAVRRARIPKRATRRTVRWSRAISSGSTCLRATRRGPASSTAALRASASRPMNVAPGITRLVLTSAGRPRAAIVAMPKESTDTGWLAFVEVEDVAATSAKVVAGGGKVLVAPRPDLLGGHGAIVADPLGGVVGIVNGRKATEAAAAAAASPASPAAPATARGTAK